MTKQELTAALDIKKDLRRLEARLSDLEATGGVRTSLQPAGGRGGPQSTAAIIAGELTDEITALRKQLEKKQNYLEVALDQIEMDKTERKLMTLRYVDCKEWKEVALRMAYSRDMIMKKHAAILERMKLKKG